MNFVPAGRLQLPEDVLFFQAAGPSFLLSTSDPTGVASNSITFSVTSSAIANRPVSSSNSLTFSSLGVGDTSKFAAADNSLTFSVQSSNIVDRYVSANNTLTFNQESRGLAPVVTSNVINFNQSVAYQYEIVRGASNSLTFNQNPNAYTLRVSASNTVSFTGATTFRRNPLYTSFESILDFQHSAQVSIAYGSGNAAPATSSLSFEHSASVAGSEYLRSASNLIEFTNTPTSDKYASGSNSLIFSHSATGKPGQGNSLTFNHSASFLLVKPGRNNLTFSQSAAAKLIANRAASNNITFNHSGEAEAINPSFCEYDDGPTLIRRSSIVLTYPVSSPTTTLTLRTPKIGDVESLSINRIIRETRGGSLRIYRRANLPVLTTLKFTIDFLSREQANNYLTFLEQTAGKEIGLLDYNSQQWIGVITTPDEGFATPQNKNKSITFEFEGELA